MRSTDIIPLAELMTALLKAGMLIERMQLRTETLAFALDVQFASRVREVLQEHGERLHSLPRRLFWRSPPAMSSGSSRAALRRREQHGT